MAKAIHMMIRVLELDRSIAFYRTALGLDVADRFDFDSFTLVYLRNDEADFEVELTLNKGRDRAVRAGRRLRAHVAFCVDDLDGLHARLSAAGIGPQPIKEFHRDGGLMARFFFIQDPDGYKIEVLQRHGRYR